MAAVQFIHCQSAEQINSENNTILDKLNTADHSAELRHLEAFDDVDAFKDTSAICIKANTDYYKHYDAFFDWLEALNSGHPNVNIVNGFDNIKWNANVNYLNDLKDNGISIVDSHLVEKGGSVDIAKLMVANDWDNVVVKSSESDDESHHFLIIHEHAEMFQETINEILEKSNLVIQPFINAAHQEGQVSIVILNNEFSHSIACKPHSNNSDYDMCSLYEAPSGIKEQALKVLDIAPSKEALLYARIDGFVVGDKLIIKSLNIIDPELYLSLSEGGFDRFVSLFASKDA